MKKLNVALTLTLIGLFASSVFALPANEILKKAEDTLNAPQDRTIKEKMTLIKSDGSQKERRVVIYQKGSDKRLVVFTEPADVKGVGFLSITDNQMYLYLPAFRKIRRIASHIKNENFMGTDFSYEDMSETKFSDEYSARLEKEETNQYLLELTPLPEADVSYAKLNMWVDKNTFIPVKTEYFSKQGKLIKRFVAEEIKNVDGYWFAMKAKMETLKSGHQTVLEVLEIQHDAGISDKFFNKRNLKKQAR